MLPAKTRRRTRRAECKAFREGTYRRGVARRWEEREREKESKRGIPETITSLNGLDLSPASSFFPFPLSSLSSLPRRVIPIHRFVPVNRDEREKEKGRGGKKVKKGGYKVGYQGGVYVSFNLLSRESTRDARLLEKNSFWSNDDSYRWRGLDRSIARTSCCCCAPRIDNSIRGVRRYRANPFVDSIIWNNRKVVVIISLSGEMSF